MKSIWAFIVNNAKPREIAIGILCGVSIAISVRVLTRPAADCSFEVALARVDERIAIADANIAASNAAIAEAEANSEWIRRRLDMGTINGGAVTTDSLADGIEYSIRTCVGDGPELSCDLDHVHVDAADHLPGYKHSYKFDGHWYDAGDFDEPFAISEHGIVVTAPKDGAIATDGFVYRKQ